MESITVHIWDNARPEQYEDEKYHIHVEAAMVPRVGDSVYWWLDYPTHMPREFEQDDPIRVEGKVARVEIEFRRMEWGAPNLFKTVTSASIWLDDFRVKLPDTPTIETE